MSLDASKILAGPARIFVGVTAPATGTPPTLMTHVNGVPTTGIEVGYTEGPVEFTYKATKQEINPEQSYLAVDVFLQEEMAQVQFTCMERTYNTFKYAFDNVGTVTDASKDLFYFGNGTQIITPLVSCIMFSSPRRDNGAKFTIGVLYKAYNPEGIKLPFTKTKPMTYAMTLKSLADTNRNFGDQGGQFFIEK